MRSTIVPEACGFRDSSALAEIRNSLEGLDTTTFTENLTVYYSDLALVYYEPTIGSSSTDSAAVQKAASAYRSALFHDPGNTAALWNLVFCCYHLGDCAGVEQYLRRYLAADQRRNWDRKTIRYLRGSCGLHL